MYTRELGMLEANSAFNNPVKPTHVQRGSSTTIDFMYVSTPLIANAVFDIIENILSDHKGLFLKCELFNLRNKAKRNRLYQLHPAFKFNIDQVNVIYAITSGCFEADDIDMETWEGIKKSVSRAVMQWNKKFVLDNRTELMFLEGLAVQQDSFRGMDQEAVTRYKSRLNKLQDDDLKLRKCIHVRNLRVAKSELNLLLKTTLFHYLKPMNLISVILHEGTLLMGREAADLLNAHLKKTFDGETEPVIVHDNTLVLRTVPSQNLVDEFCRDYFSFENIRTALFEVNKHAPAGPDMISLKMLKRFDYIFIPILVKVFSGWVRNDDKNQMNTSTCFVAFNKKPLEIRDVGVTDQAVLGPSLNDVRPINIQDVDSKIFARILNRILVQEVQLKIHRNQFCLRGRSISMAINLLKETHLAVKVVNDNKALVALLDMKAAFDRVKIEFLVKELRELIQNEPLVASIENYLTNKNGAVKFFGELGEKFKINVGISQGSPMSSTSYAIYTNSLLCELDTKLVGVYVPILDSFVKLVAYADDLVLILRDRREWKIAVDIINSYTMRSGLLLNLSKSGVFRLKDFGSNDVLPLVGKKKFLGLPFPFFGNRARAETQGELLRKTVSTIRKVQFCSLSLISRVEFINKILIPKLVYVAKFFSFTKKFYSMFESILSKFLWGNKISLISKHVLSASREMGGLGLIRIQWFLPMLRANLMVNWMKYIKRCNIVLAVEPQDTPPPIIRMSDFMDIRRIRLNVVDDLPACETDGKLRFEVLRKYLIDVTLVLTWKAAPSFMRTVRRIFIPINVLSFLYKLSWGRLALRTVLVNKFRLNIADSCPMCEREVETMYHLFVRCEHFASMWKFLQNTLEIDIVTMRSLEDLLDRIISNKVILRIMCFALYLVWRMRCFRVFQDLRLRPSVYLSAELKGIWNTDKAALSGQDFLFFWPRNIVSKLFVLDVEEQMESD